jgi:hypothetical protein
MSRRIQITESQLKYIIENIDRLDEEKTTSQSQTFNLNTTFESGQYKEHDLNQPETDKVVQGILSFVKKYPNSKFGVTIEASESKVPNPAGFETQGSLARARANTIIKYLQNKLGDTAKIINFNDPSIKVGGPEWDTAKGKDHQDYRLHQYIKGKIEIIGSREEIPWGNYKIYKDAVHAWFWYKKPEEKTWTQNSMMDQCKTSPSGSDAESYAVAKGSCSTANVLAKMKEDGIVSGSLTQEELVKVTGMNKFQGEGAFKSKEAVNLSGEKFFQALKNTSIGNKVRRTSSTPSI